MRATPRVIMARADRSGDHASERETTYIIVIVKVVDLKLRCGFIRDFRPRQVADDRFKQRGQIPSIIYNLTTGSSSPGIGVEYGEIKLVFICVQVDKEIVILSRTSAGHASARSILLIQTTAGSPASSAFFTTKRVWGSGPSQASTSSRMPSTIESARSTSPLKSEWPGVSTMLMRTPFHRIEAFLAIMVIPRSRSSAKESMTRSSICSLGRKAPDCRSNASTRVVLP